MKNFQKFQKQCLKGLVLSMLFIVQLSHARDIYVSKNGNDANNGSATAPFLTIQKASSIAQPGDVIIIGGGTYEETIRPARSGRAGSPIVYTAKQAEKVIVSAMQALRGWQKDNGVIYKTKVDWDLGQENFVMNGNVAMDLARWPNNTDGKPFTLNSLRNDGGSNKNVSNGAFLTSSKIPNINWKGGAIFFYGDRPGSGWIAWKAFITSSSSGRVNFNLDKNPTWIRTFHDPASKGDFYLEGVKGALDYQNEWWFNSQTKELFVQMPNGAAPVNGKVQMRRRKVTIDLNQRNFIEIKNLAVFGGAILMKSNSNNNRLYRVSSFYGNHTQGIFKGFNAGKPSVEVNGKNNVVEKCEIAFSAATGVRLGGNSNRLVNNYIHDFNYLGSYDAPLVARGGTDNKILRNTIFNSGRDGINFNGNRCEIGYNDVSRSNLINDDCALFYTVGGPQNTEIHHNWFHDAESRGKLKKAAGIYLDNDAEAFSVHHNVVWNVEWTNVQINWDGKDLDIFNNTLVKAKGGTMGAWHKAGTKFTNVKVWNNITDRKVTDQAGNQETEVTWEPQSDKQNNLIDKNSFVNHAGNNFKLKPNAKAVDYGRVINGITNGYKGKAPDVGAYEFGDNWVPGINWNPEFGPTGLGCYGLPGESCNNPDTGGDTSRPDANLEDGIYYIENPYDNKKLNSPNGRTVDLANTSANSAKWEIVKSGKYYTIKNLRNNEYFEVPYAACEKNDTTQNPNLNFGTWTGATANHQKWSITKVGEDYFLEPLHCTKVVDRNNGNTMHLWAFQKGNKNQNWKIVSAEEKCNLNSELVNLKISNTTETSLTLAFDEIKNVSTYELRAWVKGQFNGNINTPAALVYKGGNSSPLTIDGLQADKQYTLVLRAVCASGGTTKLAQIDASTLRGKEACDGQVLIENLKVKSSTNSSITVSFKDLLNVRTYELRAWPKGQFTGNINSPKATSYKGSSTPEMTIGGLQQGKEYTLVLRAICNAGVTTKLVTLNASTKSAFSRTTVSEKNEVRIYPNPLKFEKITIAFNKSNNNESSKVTIFDITGKLILERKTEMNTVNLNRSDFGNTGIYFIKVEQNNKIITKKVIIQ